MKVCLAANPKPCCWDLNVLYVCNVGSTQDDEIQITPNKKIAIHSISLHSMPLYGGRKNFLLFKNQIAMKSIKKTSIAAKKIGKRMSGVIRLFMINGFIGK